MPLKPVVVKVDQVKPYAFGDTYLSRMILDHVITGQEDVIQINHGTVKAGAALDGAAHQDDEIYYMLSGCCKLKLEDDIIDVSPNQVIFIPGGVFHALDNTAGLEDVTLLTFWRNYKSNEAYEVRIKEWGKSFKTVDED